MSGHIDGKSIIVTGAGSGFGRLVSQMAAERGARITCGDIDADAVQATVATIAQAGGEAQAVSADVTQIADMNEAAARAVEAYGAIDVLVNNAGVMPLAFYSDHEQALEKWHQCIDVNFKGVLNGIVSVYDQMLGQGHGHVVNLSSIYGNFPVAGAAVYGATKSAVNFLSEALRVESRGKVKVTTIRPTGVPGTNLATGILNPEAVVGLTGQFVGEFAELFDRLQAGQADPGTTDENSMACAAIDPVHIANAILHAIDQPRGISIGDITVRGAGDYFVL